MSGPPPGIAATRLAVRPVLADLGAGARVVVAVSGGADSLALAAAAADEAGAAGVVAVGVVVDHGLQAGSATVAEEATRACVAAGLARVEVVPVAVAPTGAGPEADARTARYAALDAAAERCGAPRFVARVGFAVLVRYAAPPRSLCAAFPRAAAGRHSVGVSRTRSHLVGGPA